ncbi:hypothetical protein VPH35_093955 [Triticum aestivum]
MAGAQGSTMPAAAPEAEAEAGMDIELSRGSWAPNFGFAFDSERFSDKVLQIAIVANGEVAGGSLTEPASHRADKVLRVRTMNVSSVILSASSSFFHKLFSNGMKESEQTHATLEIADSEENALMELLRFMYCGKLRTAEPAILLDILMVADKFEVPSCMRDCSQLLTSLPMTTESALLYLDHPCSILIPATVHHLIVAAKDFLAKKYSDVHKFQDELMNMSLAGIEAIFSSTDLHVVNEDCLYRLLLKWARARYPELEERRKILNHEQITKCVTEVLLCKAYPAHRPDELAACATSSQQFVDRAYKCRHLKVVAFDQPCPQVIAYMDLKREECSQLFPSEQIFSHPLHVAGQGFILGAGCNMVQQIGSHRFGIFLYINLKQKGSTGVSVNYEFAARTRPSGHFVSKYNASHTFTDSAIVACRDPFSIPWEMFLADDNPFFISGVLHLRLDLKVVEQT